jgi:hypothetical protein
MDNTRARRHNLEVVESTSTPLEELEAFTIARELEGFVLVTSIGSTRNIDLYGVINDEVDGAKGVDL